jgi:hypothetical protein
VPHQTFSGAAKRKVELQELSGSTPARLSRAKLDGKVEMTHSVPQTRKEIRQVEPTQEPGIKASDLFTFTKRALSAEARELLAKIDEGGIPLAVTENLERIARSHGIEVSRETTPSEIVRRLRKLA